jgi:hypothetical protein
MGDLHGAPNDNSALGINLAGVTYWSSEIVFVDLFRHAQTFKSQAPGKGYGEGGPLDLTETGWVHSLRSDGQFTDSIVFSQPKLGYPAGVYTCLYEGQGKIEFAYGTRIVEEKPGRIPVDVKSEQNLLTLRITQTDPADPVRNVRMILPGFEGTYQDQPFHRTSSSGGRSSRSCVSWTCSAPTTPSKLTGPTDPRPRCRPRAAKRVSRWNTSFN